MQVHGHLRQAGDITTLDETLIFATKTTGSRNFYLALAATIAGSATQGYWLPHASQLRTIIASITSTVSAPVTFQVRNLNTGAVVGQAVIAVGQTNAFIVVDAALPEGAELGMYCSSTVNVANPIARLLISQK